MAERAHVLVITSSHQTISNICRRLTAHMPSFRRGIHGLRLLSAEAHRDEIFPIVGEQQAYCPWWIGADEKCSVLPEQVLSLAVFKSPGEQFEEHFACMRHWRNAVVFPYPVLSFFSWTTMIVVSFHRRGTFPSRNMDVIRQWKGVSCTALSRASQKVFFLAMFVVSIGAHAATNDIAYPGHISLVPLSWMWSGQIRVYW